MTSRRFARKLYRLVARYPKQLLGGILIVSLVFLWQIPRLQLDPSIKSLAPRDHPILKTMDEVDERFGGSAIIILAVQSDSLLTKSVLTKFAAFQDSLEAIELINSVTSIYTTSNIFSTGESFSVEPLLDVYSLNEGEMADLKTRLSQNEFVMGNLMSYDFRTMAFVCRLRESFDYDEHALRDQIEHIVAVFSPFATIYYSGLPITRAEVTDNMRADLRNLMPYGFGLMILFLALSFRSWRGVLLPLLVVVISVIWTFGLMAALGLDLPFTGILIPVMLIAIANNYGIHIIAHYNEYLLLYPQDSKEAIIKRTIKRLVLPIFLAGLTTVIGFLSLLGHVLPKIREMGLFMSFGIFVAFAMSLLVIPAFLNIARRPAPRSHSERSWGMDRFLQGWGNFFIKYRLPFLWLLTAVMIGLAIGINRIVVDTNPDNYYDPKARIVVHDAAISKVFGGSTFISILIEGDVRKPETLRKIDQIARHLQKHPIVSRTLSIVEPIKKMHRAFHGGKPEYEVIPDDEDLIAQYLFLYSLTGNESDFDQFVDDIDEPEYAQLLVRLRKVATSEVVEIVEDTYDYIRANFYDGGRIELTGPATLLAMMAKFIVQGQMVSLTISIIVVFIIMALVFRSLVGGLLGILPLLTAIITVFGLMGYLNIELNIATAMVSSIMIGVGVDYTVHFLWHLREHIREGMNMHDAIFTTLRISGKGIVFNAFSVIVGFAVLVLSVFQPVNFFGFLIIFSIFMCLFGALALLPSVVSWLEPKFLFKAKHSTNGG
ncbi:MAG: RND family transporter [Fidelibacterota bacterium]